MKNPQENLATLAIWSSNVLTSTREPTTCAWIRADICRQDGVICSKNRKIVPYHRCARIPRLTVSIPNYDSWFHLILMCFSLRLCIRKCYCVLKKTVVYQEFSLCSERNFSVRENFVVFSKRLFCSRKNCCVLEKIAFLKRLLCS